jgi:ribosomal protein S18 acetylase RimI-like enzyme
MDLHNNFPQEQEIAVIRHQLQLLQQQAREKHVAKAEVIVQKSETSLFEPIAQSLKFSPGLHTLRVAWPAINNWQQPVRQSAVKVVLNQLTGEKLQDLLTQQAEYHHQYRPDYYLSPAKINWVKYLTEITQATLQPGQFQLVALVENQPVGLLLAELQHNQSVLYIMDLIVAEQFRRRGIGLRLLLALSTLSLEPDTVVETDTWPEMPAYAWYQRLGFDHTASYYYWLND